ncbi:hypothetical protein Cs7R123_47380 [Catellatospora sp. TT07R-123]|nr:hypothetical protein Cs7R123_47380 [Catellatospora sp. TT07R-123]
MAVHDVTDLEFVGLHYLDHEEIVRRPYRSGTASGEAPARHWQEARAVIGQTTEMIEITLSVPGYDASRGVVAPVEGGTIVVKVDGGNSVETWIICPPGSAERPSVRAKGMRSAARRCPPRAK